MQLSHMLSATSVLFDDPNLVASAGLVPVLALARRCGLHKAAGASLTVPSPNAAVKVSAVVAGMVVGADSIDDLDRLRHGGMGRLFSGIRAPSTLGTFLRTFTFGHVKQLDKVAATLATARRLRVGVVVARWTPRFTSRLSQASWSRAAALGQLAN